MGCKRFLSKNNYLIQTDAVKRYLLPQMNYRENLQWLAYAEEADILKCSIIVPDKCQLAGAIGAAIIAYEDLTNK